MPYGYRFGPPRPAILAASLLLACDQLGLGRGDEHGDLSLAIQQWNEHGASSYSMTVTLTCFCAPPVGTPVRVTVRDDEVVDALDLETGEELNPAWWFTIDELLARLEAAAARGDLREARFGERGVPSYAYTGELANDSGVVCEIEDFDPA